MKYAVAVIFAELFAVARSHLPRGRDGLLLLLLATLVPQAASCGVHSEGLGQVTPQPETDGGSRDGGSIRQVDGRADASPDGSVRLDGARDSYAPPQSDARDTAAPVPDTRLPPDTAPPDAASPDTLPADTASPPPPDTSPGLQVLLLVGDAMISPGDAAVRTHLMALGFQVMVKQAGNDGQIAEARALAAGASLVVMSNSLPQGAGLPTQMRDLAVPILCSKAAFWDNLGIGQPQGNATASGETNLQIRSDHALAAGRRGEIVVTTQPRPFGLGIPVPAAIRVATIFGETDEVLIFGLEKGAAGRFGASPARRVGWFAHEATYLSLNDNGWALFDAAVKWLTGS